MSLGTKIPVELSEARTGRIARGLFEKLDQEERGELDLPEPTGRKRAWALAAATAVAAVALLAIGVHFYLGWSTPHVLAEANPSRVVTGAMGSHLALGGMSIDVDPESELVASGNDELGMLIVLDRGSITCDVTPRGGRPPVIVQAGGVRVRVVGTRFTVRRDGEDARVVVAHGTVEIEAHGTLARVSGGESWLPWKDTTRNSAETETPAASPPALRPEGAAAPASRSESSIRRSTARATAGANPTGPARASTSATAPAAGAASAEKAAEATPADPKVSPAETPQQLFEEAAQLEGHDGERAIGMYRELAAGPSLWAANALFAEASLEQARGNHAEAQRLFEAYLARYPQGPNARDARTDLDRLK